MTVGHRSREQDAATLRPFGAWLRHAARKKRFRAMFGVITIVEHAHGEDIYLFFSLVTIS